jgi:hypothetical protein
MLDGKFNINVILVWDMVAYAYNPSSSEGRDGGSRLKVSLGKLSNRLYLKNKLKIKGLGVWLKW